VLLKSLMNSRRLMGFTPLAENHLRASLIRTWSDGHAPHRSMSSGLMSALGQKQTLGKVRPMSALPPKADIALHRSECPLCAKSRHEGTDDIVGPNGCPQPMSNHSAAIAVGMRGQDGLGTGCHHFWTLRSRAITLAALYPGLPVTAPPVWLLAPHRYSPLIGVL